MKTYNPQNIDSRIFSDQLLKKITKISWFEKIILHFIKKQFYVDKIENKTTVYKIWRGKTFILNHFSNPPIHPMCRCVLEKEEL